MKISKSTVFSVVAAAGVVATFIFTAKAAPKAKQDLKILKEEIEEPTKLDIVKTVVPTYAPAVMIGLATIFCIFESNQLNKKQQATLASAYILANESHKRYQDKLKELYGEEAHNRILDELAAERADAPDIYAHDWFNRYSSKEMYDPQDTRLFYDPYSDRYFESTLGSVMDAEYHLNRNYVLRGLVTLNEFYDFLGVSNVENGDILGWDCTGDLEGIWWLDFNHHVTTVKDNVKCVVIDVAFEPHLLDETYQLK